MTGAPGLYQTFTGDNRPLTKIGEALPYSEGEGYIMYRAPTPEERR